MILTVFCTAAIVWCVFAIGLVGYFARVHYEARREIERRLNQPPVAAKIIRTAPKATEKPAANSNTFTIISNPLKAS
jgi:hypothetical protein